MSVCFFCFDFFVWFFTGIINFCIKEQQKEITKYNNLNNKLSDNINDRIKSLKAIEKEFRQRRFIELDQKLNFYQKIMSNIDNSKQTQINSMFFVFCVCFVCFLFVCFLFFCFCM